MVTVGGDGQEDLPRVYMSDELRSLIEDAIAKAELEHPTPPRSILEAPLPHSILPPYRLDRLKGPELSSWPGRASTVTGCMAAFARGYAVFP